MPVRRCILACPPPPPPPPPPRTSPAARACVRSDADGEEPGTRLSKAERLLKDGWPPGAPWAAPAPDQNTPKYSPDHALELCAKHRFKRGLIFLYRKQGATMKEQQVRGYM